MGVNALIPVDKAFYVNYVAGLKGSESFVGLGAGSGEVSFNAELVALSVLGSLTIFAKSGIILS